MYQYPYGNAQQLNLDWILNKLKELEIGSGATLEEVSNALIALNYAEQNYNLSDIVFHNGKLYSANQNITAEPWNTDHWNEVLLANPVSNLVRYVSALNNSQVYNSSNVAGTHTSDALNNLASDISDRISRGDVDISTLTDSWLLTAKDGVYKATGTSRTGTFVENADNNFGLLTIASAPQSSADYGYIAFHSTTGRTFYRDFTRTNGTISWRTALQEIATESEISALNGAITSVENGLAIIVTGDTCSTAVPAGGYAYIKNNTHGLADGLYRNKTASAFPTSGGTANSTVFEAVSSGIANQVTPVSLGGTGGNSPWAAKENLQVPIRTGSFVVQASGTTINVPTARQFYCFADGGLFMLAAGSNGGTYTKTMIAAAQTLTFNTSVLNKITITPASYEVYIYWICFFDNAITT